MNMEEWALLEQIGHPFLVNTSALYIKVTTTSRNPTQLFCGNKTAANLLILLSRCDCDQKCHLPGKQCQSAKGQRLKRGTHETGQDQRERDHGGTMLGIRGKTLIRSLRKPQDHLWANEEESSTKS